MEIKKIADVHSYIDHSLDVVFFDIDNTILETETGPNLVSWAIALEKYIRSHQHMKNLSDHDFFTYVQEKIVDFIEHMKPALVEEEVLGVIHSLEQNNIPVIGLTNRPLKSVDVTIQQLHRFGLDFSSHPFGLQEYHFETQDRPARFKDGIIVGNSNNKGFLIREFLEKIRFRPKKVLFVDDCEHFVSDVEKVLSESKTEVVALRYGFLDEKDKNFLLTPEMIPEELR